MIVENANGDKIAINTKLVTMLGCVFKAEELKSYIIIDTTPIEMPSKADAEAAVEKFNEEVCAIQSNTLTNG